MPAGSELHDMALAFNRAYAKFLKTLTEAYNGEPQLLMSAVPQMFEFRNLMTQLVRNPLPGTGYHAAPTFEVHPPTQAQVLPAPAATAWTGPVDQIAAFTSSDPNAIVPVEAYLKTDASIDATREAPAAPAAVAGVATATSRLDRFLAFSAEVTAFTVFDLQGTGQAEAYLQTADASVGAAVVDELFAAYRRAENVLADGAREAYLRREIFGNEKLGPIARNIIKMWYSGVWYELPTAWTEAYGPAPKDVTFVVSASSYVEGLLWTAIGAHPAGAKAPGYGSWADPPNIPPVAGAPARRPLPIAGKR
jgi:hypothetical protein